MEGIIILGFSTRIRELNAREKLILQSSKRTSSGRIWPWYSSKSRLPRDKLQFPKYFLTCSRVRDESPFVHCAGRQARIVASDCGRELCHCETLRQERVRVACGPILMSKPCFTVYCRAMRNEKRETRNTPAPGLKAEEQRLLVFSGSPPFYTDTWNGITISIVR